MQVTDIALALMIAMSALICAVLALLILARLAPAPRAAKTPPADTRDVVAFLLEDGVIVDATPRAHLLLSSGPDQMEDWPRLQAALSFRFPDLASYLAGPVADITAEIPSADGSAVLRIERTAGVLRIELEEPAGAEEAFGHATPENGVGSVHADELESLRTTVDAAPLLMWKEDAAGTVRWANAAYLERALAANPESETLSWPLPQLFPAAPWRSGDTASDTPAMTRLTLPCPEGSGPIAVTASHFLAHRERTGDSHLIYAMPADDLVTAETQLREFVQTLTKTFAHLPIGLAVFDRKRRLAVFNPALTDLTKLQPLFLSRQPTLFDFLDQLREARRMPEPKDYRDWKQKISTLEHASSNGTHIETWALPDGTTFRVTGRPHPDGGIAFLIQDITSEVSLTRRFRSELELGQAVVDSLPEAIAVFSAARDLVLTNTAFEEMWDGTLATTLRPVTLRDSLRLWEETCAPSPLWADLRGTSLSPAARKPWTGEVRRLDGRGLRARLVPLAGNALLVGFSDLSAPRAQDEDAAGGRASPSEPGANPAEGRAPRPAAFGTGRSA